MMSVGQAIVFVSNFSLTGKVYVDVPGFEVKVDMSDEAGMLILRPEGFISRYTRVTRVVEISVISFQYLEFETYQKLIDAFSQLDFHSMARLRIPPVHRNKSAQDLDGIWMEFAQRRKGVRMTKRSRRKGSIVLVIPPRTSWSHPAASSVCVAEKE